MKVNFAEDIAESNPIIKETIRTEVVHNDLKLKAGEKVDKLIKVYWSRKYDKILARISIVNTDVKPSRNIGSRSGGGVCRFFPNSQRTIPLKKLKR